MIDLLLHLYPARWRARYGDEFAAVLEERPLGPFDVADILLGALDAHLHLRGLGAASEHGKGFAMSLRIGGYAAIAGGVLWFVTLAIASATSAEGAGWMLLLLLATVLLLVGLVGLSAFQARTHPLLTWAAFVLPAIGAVISVVGMIGMAVRGDARFIGDASAWYVWLVGTAGLIFGSALFALATLRTRALSRPAAALLAFGAIVIVPVLMGLTGGVLPDVVNLALSVASFAAFAGGWAWLGVSAVRVDRGVIAPSMGGA